MSENEMSMMAVKNNVYDLALYFGVTLEEFLDFWDTLPISEKFYFFSADLQQ